MIGEGFILTSRSFDNDKGQPCIELWLACDDGPKQLIINSERPVLFCRQADRLRIQQLLQSFPHEYKTLTLTSFQHEAMAALYFASLSDFFEARKLIQRTSLEIFEHDIKLQERFLMERFCYGSIGFTGEQVSPLQVIQAKAKPSQYQPQLSCLSLDIECSGEGELFSIGYYLHDEQRPFKKVCMIGDKPKNAEDWIEWLADEKALLEALVRHIHEQDPDIIIGWNVINFDFRLLIKRAELHDIKLKLGRDHSEVHWRDSRLDDNDGFISISGRVVVDGIDALKAETYNFPSFSLEAVAQTLLNKGKSTEDVDNRLAAIEHDFIHNKVKLAKYNLQDCILVWEIFEHTKVLDFLIFRSKLTGLALDKRGGSVAAFTNLYLPKLHRAGYISPNLPANGGLQSPGGYVMSSKPGLYRNVLVLDFKSLYPSIIRTFKIDPLGLIKGLKDPEAAIEGFKGAYFSRQQHFLPALIETLWQQRDKAKQEQDSAKSNAIKIIMNSFYGVLGSGGCRFYDTRLASSITMRGHEIMQQTAKWIEALGYEVIYGDTDSTFVLLDESLDAKTCEGIGQSLVQEINANWQHKLQEELQLPSHLELEFETHYQRFLMPTIRGLETGSKKRYAGLKVSAKGEEEIIFKGLETVRSDWTALAKQFQAQLFDDIFHDRDPSAYIRQFVFDTIQGKHDDLLVYRKRLRKPLHTYTKNIPPHVRAAMHADLQNAQQGKALQYQNRAWIEYIISVNGPQTLDHKDSLIDYEHYVIKQLQAIADALLPFIGLSFAELFEQQLPLL